MFVADVSIDTHNIWDWLDKGSGDRIRSYNKRIKTDDLVSMKYILGNYVCDIVESLQCYIPDMKVSDMVIQTLCEIFQKLLQGIKKITCDYKSEFEFNVDEQIGHIKVTVCRSIH